ncbi:MAG: hypothetical protein RLY93_13040 [Sumerlaeia bacterium]
MPHDMIRRGLNPHALPLQLALLGALFLLYALVNIPLWDLTYWDFGDGNYLYVGARMNDGLVPYRDILAPQPPLHLALAALAQKVGVLVADSQLIGARLYCLLVRLAQAALIYVAARQVFGCMARAIMAAGVYLFLPIGFWWGLCLQSENIEIVFLMAAFCGLLTLRTRWVVWAGVASALAMHCNMTGVPYFLVNALFLLCRRPRLAVPYITAALGVWGLGAALAYAWAGFPYLDNVVLNQVGSFPNPEILAASGSSLPEYVWGKWRSQGFEVLVLEAPFLLLAALSLALGTRERLREFGDDPNADGYRRWEFAAWSALGMWLSIGFTAKGGTANYIFVLGEPAVALFAADGLVRGRRTLARLIRREKAEPAEPAPAFWPDLLADMKSIRFGATLGFLRPLFLVLAVAFGIFTGWLVFQNTQTALKGQIPHNFATNLWLTTEGLQSELPEPGVRQMMRLIDQTTQPGDPILAPPFYAWATDRKVAGELAENYLWQIKWMNEQFYVTKGTGEEGEGMLKMQEVAAMLRRREIPLLLLDLRQTGRVPVIADAVARHYVELPGSPFQSRNTQLGLFVPQGADVPEESDWRF